MRSVAATDGDTGAVDNVVAELREVAPGLVLFFASPQNDFDGVAIRLRDAFPDALTAGCTTMGELGPAGCTKGGLSAIGFGAPLRAAGASIDDLTTFRFEDGLAVVRRLCADLGFEPADLRPDRHCFVTLTDGLSGTEEILVTAIGTWAPQIPLVGGSAGDDFRLERTYTALHGAARSGSAVVLLIEPRVRFVPFHVHHFHPTEQRAVVTAAEPDRRLVREIDGWPAIEGLARVLDVPTEELRRDPTLRDHQVPFGMEVAGRFYLRSVMHVQPDGSLLMGGAVEPGTVLRVMRAGDLVAETRAGLDAAVQALGAEPAGMLLFSCGGRMFEAESQGLVEPLGHAMCRWTCAGFTTYGEQFGPMQMNHTLTGLVLGAA